jgi:hypothetical protein
MKPNIDSPIYGGAEGIRTPDLLRAREALSRLSYSPEFRNRINYINKHLIFTNSPDSISVSIENLNNQG